MTDLIHKFYTSLQNLDAEGMVECYHDEIEFTDPAFGSLQGERAMNLWRMLCSNATDLIIDYSVIKADKNKGIANWVADYTFHRSGRKVHNEIIAKFEFKDDMIIRHTDDFNLQRWARQAIGIKGLIFGGTTFFKQKLNIQTNKLLDKFELESRNN